MQTCMDKKWKKNHQSWKSVNLYRWTIYLNLFEYLWNANTTKNIAKFDQEVKTALHVDRGYACWWIFLRLKYHSDNNNVNGLMLG